jgi:hypothetical protein
MQSTTVIHPKVAADRLEAVPPCMVGLNTFVCYDRSNEINHALVTALCEQRAIVGALDKAQQTPINQVLMYWHQPVHP